MTFPTAMITLCALCFVLLVALALIAQENKP